MGPSSATMSSKADEIGRVLSEPVVDLWKLRELALTEGGLVNDSLRKLAWPKLVGINLDLNSATPSSKNSPSTSNISVPPSLDSEQIGRDVSRVTWHLLTGNQRSRNFQMKNKHRKRIGTLLKKKQRRLGDFLNLVLVQSYGEDDGEEDKLRYYQGYHDIASIFLSALGGGTSIQTTLSIKGTDKSGEAQAIVSDIQEAHTTAAGMGLTLACQVLQQVSRSHYRDAMRSNFNQLNAALRLIIMPLTAAFDAEVHSHLYDCEMEPFFALSWIITWFSHDVRDTSLVKRLFDFFISSHPLMSIYMSVAMMIHPLNRIEILCADCDFACVHNVLADLPKNSSNVGWKYVPRDGGSSGYVSGDDDNMSANEGSLLDQSCDEPEEEGSQISSAVLNNPRNARVPFQELIDLSISLMHKIPPRNLINLARRYHTEVTLQPLMAGVSTIALFQPPPSRCLASYADSDWLLKQKVREEHGVKLNRHQRKKRSKLGNTDREYHRDEVQISKYPTKESIALNALIASGTGPDGRAEERKVRKRRRMMVRSVAIVLLSLFAASAKNYFSPPIGDTFHKTPQRPRDMTRGEGAGVSIAKSVDKTCQEGACFQEKITKAVNPKMKGTADKDGKTKTDQINEMPSENTKEATGKSHDTIEDAALCAYDEDNENQPKLESVPPSIQTVDVSIGQEKKKSRPPTSDHVNPFKNIVHHLLSTFQSLRHCLDIILIKMVKMLHLDWHHAGWTFQKISPTTEKVIMEVEDGMAGRENLAQQSWSRRAVVHQKYRKKVTKVAQRCKEKLGFHARIGE